MLTPELFEAVGRLAFQFAALEELIGLCIWELNADANHEQATTAIWNLSFEGKLKKLKQSLIRANVNPDEQLLKTARQVARQRNTVMHGTLYHDPEAHSWVLRNRSWDTSVPPDPEVILALVRHVREVSSQFTPLRGYCKRVKWNSNSSR